MSEENLGYTGPTGPIGEKGAPGENLVGDIGLIGDTGDKGFIGNKGQVGNTGDAGNDYLGEGLKGLRGDEGDTGEIGIPGIDGPDGQKGEKGEAGPTGVRGFVGEIGEAGDKGDKGEKGGPGPTGVTGHRGYIGSKGDLGAKGEQGNEGVKGVLGLNGDIGDKGEIGEQGTPGPEGAQGVKGLVGSVGPQGLVGGIGQTGPTGAKGGVGPIGKPGLRGEKGPQGNKGDKGDIGSTGFAPAFLGPLGPVGPKGEKGLAGPKGAKGIQGDVGILGPTGLAAEDGDKGDVGITGILGDRGHMGPTGHTGPLGGSTDWLYDEAAKKISLADVSKSVGIGNSNAEKTNSLDIIGDVNIQGGRLTSGGLNYLQSTDSVLLNSVSSIKSTDFWNYLAAPGPNDRKTLLAVNDNRGVQVVKSSDNSVIPTSPYRCGKTYKSETYSGFDSSSVYATNKMCGFQMKPFFPSNPENQWDSGSYKGYGFYGSGRFSDNTYWQFDDIYPSYYIVTTNNGLYYKNFIQINRAYVQGVMPESVYFVVNDYITGENKWKKITSVPGEDPSANFIPSSICWVPNNSKYYHFDYSFPTDEDDALRANLGVTPNGSHWYDIYGSYVNHPHFSKLKWCTNELYATLTFDEISGLIYDASMNVTNVSKTNMFQHFKFTPDITYYVVGEYKVNDQTEYLSKYNPSTDSWSYISSSNGYRINGKISSMTFSPNLNKLFITGDMTSTNDLTVNTFLIYDIPTSTFYSPNSLSNALCSYKHLHRYSENIVNSGGDGKNLSQQNFQRNDFIFKYRTSAGVYGLGYNGGNVPRPSTIIYPVANMNDGSKIIYGPNRMWCCGDGDANGNNKIARYDMLRHFEQLDASFTSTGGPDGNILAYYIKVPINSFTDDSNSALSHFVGGNFIYLINKDIDGTELNERPIYSPGIAYYKADTNRWYPVGRGVQLVDDEGNDTGNAYVDDISVIAKDAWSKYYYLLIKGNFNRVVGQTTVYHNLAVYDLLNQKFISFPVNLGKILKFDTFYTISVDYPSFYNCYGYEDMSNFNNTGKLLYQYYTSILTDRSINNSNANYLSYYDERTYFYNTDGSLISSGATNSVSLMVFDGNKWNTGKLL